MRILSITTPFGLLSVEVIRQLLDGDQFNTLAQHALCFACLDGNAFGPSANEQYMPEAYANLWLNSALGDAGLPELYVCSVAEAGIADLDDDHPQYGEMAEDRRKQILDHFICDPRGDAANLKMIVDKATSVLGDEGKAKDWIGHYSATLDDTPRRLSSTKDGTDAVMRHLTKISQHGHDA